jgi:hypothetical protein
VPELPAAADQSRYYGDTSTSPAWQIAQWDIPGQKLSPFKPMSDGSLISHTDEADVQIKNGALTISQSGAILPCSYSGAKPRESDLFFAPSVRHFTPLLTLSSLRSLTQTADITVDGAILPNKTCKVNMGYALMAIVLVDQEVHPAQTFFYQLELSQVCHVIPGGLNCNKKYIRPFYYSRVNPYGADEYEPMLGQPFFANGANTHFSVNLLPRLKSIIANGPPGMDNNISHWVIANAYYGQHIWGGVTLTTRWSGLQLVAQPQF